MESKADTHDVEWRSIGPYRFRVEPPDLFFAKVDGIITIDVVRPFIDELRRFASTRPRAFWLADASGMGGMTAEARRYATNETLKIPLQLIVAFSASFPQRVLLLLMAKSARLLNCAASRQGPLVEVFETEAEARAWIDRHRRELAEGGASR